MAADSKRAPDDPHVSDELISYLELYYPDECPRSEQTPFALGMQAGQQRLIDVLRHKNLRQKDQMKLFKG